MKVGMLWLDDSLRPIYLKIIDARRSYTEKHGRSPTVCFLSDKEPFVPDSEEVGIEVRISRSVLLNHFWIGNDNDD